MIQKSLLLRLIEFWMVNIFSPVRADTHSCHSNALLLTASVSDTPNLDTQRKLLTERTGILVFQLMSHSWKRHHLIWKFHSRLFFLPIIRPSNHTSSRKSERWLMLLRILSLSLTEVRLSHDSLEFLCWLGVGAARNRVLPEAKALIEATGYPYFVTSMGKGSVPEDLPTYGGVYGGLASFDDTRNAAESSDCVLWLGNYPVSTNCPLIWVGVDITATEWF